MKDGVLIYRVCGAEVDTIKAFRPSYFSKFKCFNSAFNAFDKYFDVVVVWDGGLNRLAEYIQSFPISEFHEVTYQNNQKSLEFCYHLYKDLNYQKVYFGEDDNLYLPLAGEIAYDGLKRFQFISTYDHPDRSFLTDETAGQEWVIFGSNRHWRSAISTTCSFGTTKLVFDKTYDTFVNYCRAGQGAPEDHKCWVDLLHKGYRLFTCMPGASTHMHIKHLSPYIDWCSVNQNIVL